MCRFNKQAAAALRVLTSGESTVHIARRSTICRRFTGCNICHVMIFRCPTTQTHEQDPCSSRNDLLETTDAQSRDDLLVFRPAPRRKTVSPSQHTHRMAALLKQLLFPSPCRQHCQRAAIDRAPVVLLQVLHEALPPAKHLQQAPRAGVVLPVDLQMRCELVNPR